MTLLLRITRCFLVLQLSMALNVSADDKPHYERDVAPLLKRHCVKCHGPTKQEGQLNLATMGAIVRGGKAGAAVVPHDAEASPLWQRISSDEMPPESPLSAEEKRLLQRWIAAGTPGLKRDGAQSTDHWAFRKLPKSIAAPAITESTGIIRSPLDAFVQQPLHADRIGISPQADRATMIRRVCFDLTGLPPELDAIAEFESDRSPDAYERMVDRYLASPHYGERLGKLWLDAAGYADSNGYFNADSDRPLAYRYRDYVIRALNADLPFDQFIREQIAGDEIAGLVTKNGEVADLSADSITEASRRIRLLEATHYLRCGQDGTGESDGNEDEVRVDRYTVLETTMQNVSTGLLGLTIQCAKCHDHKFEPLTQRDYYSFQAVLIPAFPPEQWVKPNDRFVYASLPGEFEAWQLNVAKADTEITRLSERIAAWAKQHRPQGTALFEDSFEESAGALADRWSNTAPGDDQPGGVAAVKINSREAPGAIVVDRQLHLFEGGPGGDKCLSTRQSFDWTPDQVGVSIQVTFTLVSDHIEDSKPAERIGYFLALRDFNDRGVGNASKPGGNILIDGHPSEGSAVYVDYPGNDSRQAGTLGTTGYVAGRNYGVRITNKGEGKYLLQHLVDWQAEEKTITLAEADLPDGGFGFEYCCGRSFVIDDVRIETFASSTGDPLAEYQKELTRQRKPLKDAQKRKEAVGTARPGRIAWTTDLLDTPPQVHVLQRGNYKSPGEPVESRGYAVLGDASADRQGSDVSLQHGSGRRLQFATWLTEPDSPRSSLLARVQVNRQWQHHFGSGIVQTVDNFGVSGAPPSHPELLDWLALKFVSSEWSMKQITRRIVESATYQQPSVAEESRLKLDPDGRRLSRFPVRRLDAEAIRDSLLFASGDLDERMFGPYVPTQRTGSGETIVSEDNPGSRRRSIYLQQKRTQVHSLLQVFDAPSIVFNSTHRPRSTMPLQSLSLLNSDFVAIRSKRLADRVRGAGASDIDRIQRLFQLTTGRAATEPQAAAAYQFLKAQTAEYESQADAEQRAWADLNHTLLIGNAALYVD